MTDRPGFTPLHLVSFAALLALTIAGFFLVPLDQSLPVHWGISGEPDGFAPAAVALLIPLLMVSLMGLLYGVLARSERFRQDLMRGRSITMTAIFALELIALILLTGIILIGRGQEVDMVRWIVLAMFGLLALLGNVLPKSRPNSLAGIRIPSTLSNERNWRITHEWTGRLMLVLAVIGFIFTLFTSSGWMLFVALFGTIVVSFGTGIAISLRLSKQSA